jgi:hypothetical protein
MDRYMSTFDAHEAFLSHAYRQGFLAGTDDYRDWWSMWTMGAGI